MPVHIEGSVEGEKQLSRRLLIVADGVNDFTEPLHKIGGELQRSFDMNFASSGGMFGGWARRKKDYPWPILQKTGEMRGNFQQDVDKMQVKLYNPTPYFKYHQSNQPRSRLPRRVMMKIDNDRKQFIQKAFQAYIVSLIRGNKV